MSISILKAKADTLAHEAYKLSRLFPKDELYGLTSQFRRAALSVPLNIVEGYARQSEKSERQFLLIAYASLKETMYLVDFAIAVDMLSVDSAKEIQKTGDELGALLWSRSKVLKNGG